MTEQTDRLSQLSEPHRALLERMTAPAGQREGLFPATAAQRSLWFTDQLAPGTSTYNIPALLRLRGRLDHGMLAGALQGLVDEHEALRTTLVAVDGVPLQDVRATREQQVTIINAAGREEQDVIAEAIGEAHLPFDLGAGPLMRSTLWRLGPDDHLLLVVVHHSMADGWSLGVLLDDLAASLDGGRPGGAGPAAAVHPVDLALAEAAASDDAPSAAFWAERLAGASPPMLTRPEAAPPGPACGTLLLPLDAGAPGQARDLARRLGVTEYAVYFAALAAACHRAAGQRDLVLGASFARRSGRGLERTVGLLVNALPVRLSWSGDPVFGELVTLAGQALRTSMAHGSLPLERIIQDSARHRAGGRTPFLDVVFSLNQDPLPARQLGGCEAARVEVPPRTAKFPLLASIDFQGQRARICCEYDRGLLDDEFVAGLAGMLRHLLEHIADVAAVALGGISLQSPAEEAARVRLAHGPTAADVLGGRGFGAVVAAIARQEPGRAAVTEDGRQVTYGGLVTAADGLARALRARDAGQDRPVAVALPRGIDQITACLAVIRAGSYYLPLDPENPVGRNRHMLSEAGAALLVAEEGYADRLSLPGIVALPPPPPGAPAAGAPAPQDALPGQPPGRADDLAMVGYTSGSTGQPKGFAITQRGIARLLGDRRYLPADPERGFLIANAVTFDASTWEIWNTLLTGSRGVVVPRYGYTARGLGELIRGHGATAAHVTTQLFNEIVDEDPDAFAPLAELVIGGEAMSAEHVRKARGRLPGTRLLNAYGPAECSVMATMQELQTPPPGARRVPIGGPLADTEVYLLDAAMRPVPAGVMGELYIGGPGVARGYVGQPGLTAERFVPSPFSAGSRLYRTGDLARADAGGSVTYLGRADQQLKIRGFRVEPGEIESCLARHPAVTEAVVALSAVGAEPALVAYVVTVGGQLPVAQVREFLRRDLPDYMVPSAVVTLERLPLTPNGKVDRAALPAPGLPLPPARRPGPGSPLERVVLEVWAAVLGRAPDTVSVHDDFFEIGGHSLLASRAAARLERRTGHPVPLRLMFDHPTVAGLAEALGRTPAQRVGPVLGPVPRRGRLPLSFAQERLWFLHQLAPEAPLYNLPFALRLTGELRADLLHRALVLVAERHEALRTVFGADTDGVPYQQVLTGPDVALSVVRVTGDRAMRRRLADWIVRQAALAPFDLAVDLPIRATVAEIAPREHVLLVTVHHIACDGWSVRLLAEEVSVAYAALLGGAEPGWAELGVQY
ncbi:MAG TPA: amino acid adenylation domain-containing protein, partial [Streptosporangiaceae bacterium]|nr:amino acid adenylation domain-containing protein [Streptosporangiaceae bacterium]